MRRFIVFIIIGLVLFSDNLKLIPKTEDVRSFSFFDEKTGLILKNYVGEETNLLHDQELLFTGDGGKNWKILMKWSPPFDDDSKVKVEFWLPYGTEILKNIFFFNKDCGFVLSNRKIYKTVNGGKNWIYREFSYDDENVLKGTYFGIYFLNENKGFLCGAQAYLAKTMDGGKNWEEKCFWNNEYVYFSKIFFIDSLNGFIFGKPEFTGGTSIFLRTNDGGNTWKADTIDDDDGIHPFSGINDVFFFDILNGFVVSELGILYKTEDGMKTFMEIPVDDDVNIESILFIDKKTGFLCGSKYDWGTGNEEGVIYKTENGGENWQLIFKTKRKLNLIKYIKDKNIIFFGGEAGIYSLKIK